MKESNIMRRASSNLDTRENIIACISTLIRCAKIPMRQGKVHRCLTAPDSHQNVSTLMTRRAHLVKEASINRKASLVKTDTKTTLREAKTRQTHQVRTMMMPAHTTSLILRDPSSTMGMIISGRPLLETQIPSLPPTIS